MSSPIPHPSTDPATPANVARRDSALADLARLRGSVRALTHDRIEAEIRHQVEVVRRDAAVEHLRVAAEEEARRDAAFAVAQAQGYVNETEAALEEARANEATGDQAFRELSRQVWA